MPVRAVAGLLIVALRNSSRYVVRCCAWLAFLWRHERPNKHACKYDLTHGSSATANCDAFLTVVIVCEAGDKIQLLPQTIASVAGFVDNACICAVAGQSCELPVLYGAELPTRLVHAASPGLCLAACAPPTVSAPAYALPMLVGELLEITVSGLEASLAGVQAEPQAAAAVASTVRRVLGTQGWPEAVLFMYVNTLEATIELRPALLDATEAWELDRFSSLWRTPASTSAPPGVREYQHWPSHESVSFRVLSRQAASEARDARELEEQLRRDLLISTRVAAGGAEHASLLYRLGRAQELLGMSKTASSTFDALVELRGNGALDEHLHHAYMASGRTRAAQGKLEQGILRFLAAYELIPERGVEPLVEAAVACRQSTKTPNLARLFAFAAVAENQARQEDGRPVSSGAFAAAYDHLADVEALVVAAHGEGALSVIRKSLAAAARLLSNDAAPRFLWRVWKYNVAAILDKLKDRKDVIMLRAHVDDVVERLVSATPTCEVEDVLLGAAERQRGCPAFAGLLSQHLLIVESTSRSAAAAQLAISLGCDSYMRVKIPARMMHAELRAEPASGISGRQARTTFAHLCAVAHVASALPNETLQVLIMQDNAPPLAGADLPAVVERLGAVVSESHTSPGARLTPLGGDTLETSMHAYALSVDGAQRIARSLSSVFEETGKLLQSSFHALIQPLVLGNKLFLNADASASVPLFAMDRNQFHDVSARTALAVDQTASAELLLTCISFNGHATRRHDLLTDVRERYWLIPLLLRNATGRQVQLVREDAASNAQAILLLYSEHNQQEALAHARKLCRSVSLVIALERGQSGSLYVCCRSVSGEQSTATTSIPRWFQAALVQRGSGVWLNGIDFHPGLLAQHLAAWSRKPALAAQLWHDNDDINHRARNSLSLAGLAWQLIVRPTTERNEHVETTYTPLQEQQQTVRLVVSLTSIPPRMHFLPRVLASLLNQTHVPDVIYVILPRVWARGDASEWMPAVEQMVRRIERLDPRIVVQRPLVDLGPVMKVLPALELEDSRVGDTASGAKMRTLLLYLDDDWMFPPGFVHAFVAAAERNPNKLIFRSCGDGLYDAARRDVLKFWMGCSLPEAFGGVLLPLEALHAGNFVGGIAVKTIRDIVSRVVAHPTCLRGDDFVLGELYMRAHIPSKKMPADLEKALGGTQLRLMDDEYALNGGDDGIVPSRYTACAQHLTEVLDALLPLPPLLKPVSPLRLVPSSHTSATSHSFAPYRFAVVEGPEQAVQALSAGTVPLMLHCFTNSSDDREFARVLSVSRVVCIRRRGGLYLLKHLLHNASEQQAFFMQPVVTQSGLERIYSRLADIASVIQGLFRASGLSVDSPTHSSARHLYFVVEQL